MYFYINVPKRLLILFYQISLNNSKYTFLFIILHIKFKYNSKHYTSNTNYYVTGFTGIDSPYEPPENPEVVVKTAEYEVSECMMQVVKELMERVGVLIENLIKLIVSMFL